MSFVFAKQGERFKGDKGRDQIPGPGEYDPKRPEGFKADPKSAFVGDERFRLDAGKGARPIYTNIAK